MGWPPQGPSVSSESQLTHNSLNSLFILKRVKSNARRARPAKRRDMEKGTCDMLIPQSKRSKKSCPLLKVYRPAAMTSALTAMTSFGVEAYFMARNFAKILQTPGYVTKISADVEFEFGAELDLI